MRTLPLIIFGDGDSRPSTGSDQRMHLLQSSACQEPWAGGGPRFVMVDSQLEDVIRLYKLFDTATFSN